MRIAGAALNDVLFNDDAALNDEGKGLMFNDVMFNDDATLNDVMFKVEVEVKDEVKEEPTAAAPP